MLAWQSSASSVALLSKGWVARSLASGRSTVANLQQRALTCSSVGFASTRVTPRSAASRSTARSMMSSSSSSFPSSYQAWRVAQDANGNFVGSEQTLATADLMQAAQAKFDGDATGNTRLIRVTHSSLNYKDALSAAGNKGVTRSFPHTPGIDAVGYRIDDGPQGTATSTEQQQQPVLVTGYDLGMNTDGGFGQLICVPDDWIVPLPTAWLSSPRTAMIYGTAGLTAGLLVDKLLYALDQDGLSVTPSEQTVCVTGATGAVGTVAVELLAKLGYKVVAVTGKANDPDMVQRLTQLGAAQVLGREALESTKKPLVKPLYHAAIDTVGGPPLAELLKQIRPGGSVACCGLVAGMQLETTVLPFILRGVNLLGVDSVEISVAKKAEIWNKLAGEWQCPQTEATARDIGRHELDPCLKAFLTGESSGKIVLDHSRTTTRTASSSL